MGKIKKLLDDFGDFTLVAGIDEVGRGCGAGPVVSAAVIMPKGFKSPLIRDSKKLSEKQRLEAFDLITENAIEIQWCASSVSEIDELGINKATFASMHGCLDKLRNEPEHILVDGTVWEKHSETPVTLVPKGDDTYTCIAAAAIVAKITRDKIMTDLHSWFPDYGWDKNKGYLTPEHIKGIKEKGVVVHHRKQYVKNFLI